VKGGFLALTGVALALAYAGASGACGALFALARARLGRLAPAARARLLMAAALAPAAVGAAASFAVAADIAFASAPRRCAERFAEAGPRGLLTALAAAWLGWLACGLARCALASARSAFALRRLRALSPRQPGGFRLVPSREAQAFVLGIARPEVFVSAGLLRGADARALEAVLAHERAHVRRREPLRRLLAALALSFHLPGIAGALGRALRRAEEASADAEAARALGDRTRIAEALVRFARLRLPAALAAGFQEDGLELRVREMLAGEPPAQGPPARLVAAFAGATLASTLASGPVLHAALERLFELAAG
jgi:Zn-dependent protease with chaperone function